jgi:hypothetical protein
MAEKLALWHRRAVCLLCGLCRCRCCFRGRCTVRLIVHAEYASVLDLLLNHGDEEFKGLEAASLEAVRSVFEGLTLLIPPTAQVEQTGLLLLSLSS